MEQPRYATTRSGLRASRRSRPHGPDPTTPKGRGERKEPPSCAPEGAQPCSCDRGTHAPRHTPWDSMGAAPARARKVADHVRDLDTHRPSCAAPHPGLLRCSARRASSVRVDGCMGHRRRSPRTCSHHPHRQIIARNAVSGGQRRACDGSSQRRRLGGCAASVLGTGAAGTHLSLNAVPDRCGTALSPACWSRCRSALGQPSAGGRQVAQGLSAQRAPDRRTAGTASELLTEVVPRLRAKSRDESLVEGRKFLSVLIPCGVPWVGRLCAAAGVVARLNRDAVGAIVTFSATFRLVVHATADWPQMAPSSVF